MRLVLYIIGGVLLAAFIAIQFKTVKRTNPKVYADLKAPAEVKDIFRRACYDCHSNETKWPLYSHIAPFSWLVAEDVAEGRKELNFSNWERTGVYKRGKMKKEIREQVSEGEMPLWYYLPTHPSARLSAEDKKIIKDWSRGKL